jgi:hypothetical protein
VHSPMSKKDSSNPLSNDAKASPRPDEVRPAEKAEELLLSRLYRTTGRINNLVPKPPPTSARSGNDGSGGAASKANQRPGLTFRPR